MYYHGSDSEFEEQLEMLFPEEDVPHAMLRAFIDESAQPKENVPVIAVGGAVGTGLQWKNLLKAWRKALDTEGVDIFHTSEFETPEGRKGTIYDGWKQPRLNKFQQGLIDAITNNQPEVSMVASVTVEEFNRVVPPERLRRHRGANAYFFCAFMVVYQIAVWAHKMYPKQSVTYWFEEGGPHQKRFKRAYEVITDDEEVKRYYKFWLTPTFAPKDSQPGLQVADKLVYEAAKHASHYLDPNPPEKHSIYVPEEGRMMWKERYPTIQLVLHGLDVHIRMYDAPDIEDFYAKLEA